MKKLILVILLCLITYTKTLASPEQDSAYKHLYEQMDKYHETFYVYTDMSAGGNHYVLTKWMNSTAIVLNQACTLAPFSGTTCISCSYFADSASWAAVRWVDTIGCNLTGADTCYFMAKGENGNEIIRFEVGGEIGDPIPATKICTLSTTWESYTIPLPDGNIDNLKGEFCWVATSMYNTNGCTFYLDDIKYNLSRLDSSRLRFIQSYIPQSYVHDKYWALNQAYTYDNALAMLAFIAQDSLKRAKLIGDAFKYGQEHDRFFHDGRLRNAYRTGDISEHNSEARLPGWWNDTLSKECEDSYQVGTYTGDMAWVIIAWLTYDSLNHETRYRANACSLGNWIWNNCYDANGIPGYTGGYIGGEPTPEKERWKSTEHNLDVYVAFKHLYDVTNELRWDTLANLAWDFVDSMWDSDSGHFWVGTKNSDTINYFSSLDAQTWGVLTEGNPDTCMKAINWAEENCRDSCGTFQGFHFSTIRDGIWWEGTAQMCCAFQNKGDNAKADTFLDQLKNWQSNNVPVGNNKGIGACYPDSIYTGMDKMWGQWNYYNRLHIGATSWYIFALKKVNPYWLKDTIIVGIDENNTGKFVLYSQKCPNPVTGDVIVEYQLACPEKVSLRIYDVTGRMVCTLINENQDAGLHKIKWNTSSPKIRTGVYFCHLKVGNFSDVKKIIVLR
ncbi:MAG: T9SS type A sorting domain-containing protein [bacterium]|nr:T9SS type A sorting domain-containing protein [bacterium]